MGSLKELLETKQIEIAKLPKGNDWMLKKDGSINYDKIASLDGLIVYTIEHDYAGISSWMQNYTLVKLGVDTIKSMFVVVSKENSHNLYEVLKKTSNYIGGGAGSGLKDIILDDLDELDKSSKDLKSVNAIIKKDGKFIGFNTDGIGYRIGLETLLKDKNISLRGKKIVITGAGGVALPIVYELGKLEPSRIRIINRTIEKAKNISRYLNSIFEKEIVEYGGEDDLKKAFTGASLIVNVSNKGASGKFEDYTAFAPIVEDLEEHYRIAKENLNEFSKNGIISDIVLTQRDLSSSLKLARKLGYYIQDGKKMVLNQGVPAFLSILNNSSLKDVPDEKVLRNYMENSLSNK